ncbi:MAG: CHAT domain-containing protein [Candidatus Tectimicrobiota bacterium]
MEYARPALVTEAWSLHQLSQAALGYDVPPNAHQLTLWSEAWSVSQLAQASRTAMALASMAARFASGDSAVAQTVRAYQDTIAQWHAALERLTQTLGSPQEPQAAPQRPALHLEVSTLEQQVQRLEQTLERDFPAYTDLMLTHPMTLAEVGTLLQSDEALLSYVVGETMTLLLVVRPPQQIRLYALHLGAHALEERVNRLRRGLDQSAGSLQELEPFPVQQAYELYTALIAPAAPFLVGVQHLLVVPDGALQRLPFSVFVMEPPQVSGRHNLASYRQIAWLAQRYALSMLPAPSALRAVRQAPPAWGHHPVVGFGDPLVTGPPGRHKGLIAACPQEKAAVAQLAALPQSADELAAIGLALQGDPQHLYLRERATKARVRALDLSVFRVLAFSTHGLPPGCYGLTEPALLFTPAQPSTAEDDGLLTASDIAQLHLNADWTILSACNTAVLEGVPGTAGLASLAQAFFYAGSRALLVSHWEVDAEATAYLMAATVNGAAASARGRAAALQTAMQTLRHDPEHPHYAHPMFWAPFVVMGEGGRLRVP